MKAYLLPQWSFWLQQVLVIHIEERRKDHWQMLAHHFVTVTLIAACYVYHHTRVGNLILVLMDVVDLFLPVSPPGPRFCETDADSAIACEVPEIHWIHDVVRRYLRGFHALLVPGPSRLLSHSLPQYLEGYTSACARWLLARPCW